MADNQTYRKTESGMGEMRTPWDGEPVPDHTALVRHMQTIPSEWMDEILAETARRCLAETGGVDAPLGVDSSGTETARYEDVERPDKDTRDFTEKPQKVCRFEWANRLKVPIPSYDGQQMHAECA